MAAKNAPVRVGEVLAGRYEVDRILKSGGMGVVVVATDVQLKRRVAVKLMLEHSSDDGVGNARFMREARAVSRLKSEHVVRVLDIGTLTGGAPFIVMELLEGSDLRDLVDERGPLPVEEAILLVLQACEGIAEAHALGLVHRDIKPRNLFLTQRVDGAPLVKVLDFGISKWVEPLPSDTNLSLTDTAQLVGTPQYMAPEQVLTPREVDARADVWALGAVLHELLTAQMPFARSTTAELFRDIVEGSAPSLSGARPDLPAGLAEAVTKCMMHAPADRYANVAELATALEKFGGKSAEGWGARVASVLGVKAPKKVERGDTDAVPAGPWGGTKGGSTAGAPRTRAWLVAPLVLAAAGGLYSVASRPGGGAPAASASQSAAAPANAGSTALGISDATSTDAATVATPTASPTPDAGAAASASGTAPLASATASTGAGARRVAPLRPAPSRASAPSDDLPIEPH